MNNTNRLVSAACIAALVLLVVPFAVSARGQAESGKPEQPIDISWLIRVESGEKTTWFIQQLEKKFNVHITPNGIGTDDYEKVNLMLSAGEFPDCGLVGGTPEQLYRDGVIRGLGKDFIRTNMPNYAKMMDQSYPIAWVLGRNPDNENEMLAIHGVGEHNDCQVMFAAYRVDWARKVGIETPSFDAKKVACDSVGRNYFLDEEVTMDWFEKLLVAFRDGDADGNGKIDTIPWGASNNINRSWIPLMGAFGIAEGYNTIVDGKLYDWCIAPGEKDFLKLMAKWYGMGLIDKEFPSLDINKAWEKVTKGLIGASEVQVSYASGAGGYATRPPTTFVSKDALAKGGQVVILAPIKGPTGIRGGWAKAGAGPIYQYRFYINKKVDDRKAARIMQIVDYSVYDGDESFIGFGYGQPGVHFDWEGVPYNSAPLAKRWQDVKGDVPKTGGMGTPYPTVWTKDRLKFIHPKELLNVFSNILFTEKYRAMDIRPARYDYSGGTKLADLNTKYGGSLNTMANEFFYKAITGQANIDAGWDAYVAAWRKNGGDEILAEYAKTPLVSEVRKGKIVY